MFPIGKANKAESPEAKLVSWLAPDCNYCGANVTLFALMRDMAEKNSAHIMLIPFWENYNSEVL